MDSIGLYVAWAIQLILMLKLLELEQPVQSVSVRMGLTCR